MASRRDEFVLCFAPMACALHHLVLLMSEQADSERTTRGEMPEATTARAGVVQALRDFELGERDSMERLHDALCRFVATLRGAGKSCDAVVADVRSLIATPATAEGASKLPAIAREALAELTLRWCEEEYARAERS